VGKNIPTALVQEVRVLLKETDGEDAVYVLSAEASHA
jgi:pyrimidine operon attenuation protein/uracil phosphoribosyltransferase